MKQSRILKLQNIVEIPQKAHVPFLTAKVILAILNALSVYSFFT